MSNEPVTRTLERPGARLSYTVGGAAGGPAMLLGHGLLFDGNMWQNVAPKLASRFRLVTVDARGHGASTADAPFSLEDAAADWCALLDAEKIDRAILCGLSMGGMTAMRVALAAPERVAGLILVDTSADPEPLFGRLKYRTMAELTRAFGNLRPLEPSVTRILFGPTARRTQPELIARDRDRMRAHGVGRYYPGIRAVTDRGSILDRLGEIRCPALVVVGEEDAATPPLRSERIAARLSGAVLRRLPNVGHMSALEAPDAVAEAILAFLA
jgi:pimeloyl-ACP methyl ester carboxylesterase